MQSKKFYNINLEMCSFIVQMVLCLMTVLMLSNQSSVVLSVMFGFGFVILCVNCAFSGRMDNNWNTVFLNELGFHMSISDHPSDIEPYLSTIQKLKQVNECSFLYFTLIKQHLLRINVLSSVMFICILFLQFSFSKSDTTMLMLVISLIFTCLVTAEVVLTKRVFMDYHIKLLEYRKL